MIEGGGRDRRRTIRAALIGAFSLLAVAGLARAVGADGGEIGQALGDLGHPWPSWILVALVLEVASFLIYAVAQRRLVRTTGQRLSARWLASLAVSAQALNNFLPA